MSDIKIVDINKLEQDNASGPAIIDDLGILLEYQGSSAMICLTHVLSPTAGKVLVFRTHDNKYAKMEILYFYDAAYYKSGDYGGFYTFNYVYQSE